MATPFYRGQVNDLPAPQQLRVPQAVGDTYVQPEKPAIDNNLSRLAESLTGFSSVMGNVAERLARSGFRDGNDKALAEANAFIASNSRDDLYKAVREGTAPFLSHPAASAAYNKVVASNAVEQFSQDINARIASGDLRLIDDNGMPVDVEKLVVEEAKSRIAGLNVNSPHAMAGWQAGVGNIVSSLRGEQQKQMAGFSTAAAKTIVDSTFDRLINDPQLASKKPEQFAEEVRNAYKVLGPTGSRRSRSLTESLTTASSAALSRQPRPILRRS